MAFTVQTSGGILNANSYATAQEFKDYHKDRGNVIPTGSSTSDIQKVLILATDYLDGRFRFIGEKVQHEQRTQWPRISAEDPWGRVRFGVPFEVKEASIEYALIALSQALNPTPTRDDTGRKVQSTFEKTDVLEEKTVFTSGATFEMPKYPVADSRLLSSGLVVTGIEIRRA